MTVELNAGACPSCGSRLVDVSLEADAAHGAASVAGLVASAGGMRIPVHTARVVECSICRRGAFLLAVWETAPMSDAS